VTIYWIKFLTGRGRVIGSENIDASGDADAIDKARSIFYDTIRHYPKRDGGRLEVWEGRRLVHREDRAEQDPPN
jgi:hypothetical protein